MSISCVWRRNPTEGETHDPKEKHCWGKTATGLQVPTIMATFAHASVFFHNLSGCMVRHGSPRHVRGLLLLFPCQPRALFLPPSGIHKAKKRPSPPHYACNVCIYGMFFLIFHQIQTIRATILRKSSQSGTAFAQLVPKSTICSTS